MATIRAPRHHGGATKEYNTPSADKVSKGFSNLEKHIENGKKFGLTPVVAINASFQTQKKKYNLFKKCADLGVKAVVSNGWAEGGNGTQDLARSVVESIDSGNNDFKQLYDWNLSVKEKIETIAKEIYGADGVEYAKKAESDLKQIEVLGLTHLPICMAKTQKSFSDNDR